MKLSKKCKKYAKIISIIEVRILKHTLNLSRLKKELMDSEAMVNTILEQIHLEQENLRTLTIDPSGSISRLFLRRRGLCSNIESLYFDMSIHSKKCDELREEIATEQKTLVLLENKKEAWEKNLQGEIRVESYA